MTRLMILAATAAATVVLAGCTDFKATDKILRNDHRVIQKTRVVQQPAIVRLQQPTVQTIQLQPQPQQIVVQQPQVQTAARTVAVEQPQEVRVDRLNQAQVLEIQRALATRGLYRAPIDGIFGIQTAQAMAAYQRSIGQAGPVTNVVLRSLGVSVAG